MPGSWTQVEDDLAMADPTFPKASYPLLFKKTDRVIDLLKKAIPDPPGIEARVYRTVRGRSYLKDGALMFGVNALFLGYYCVEDTPSYPKIRGTIQKGGETETWIYIDFNSMSWLGSDSMKLGEGFNSPKGGRFHFVPKVGGEIAGLPIYLPDVHKNDRTEAVIISSRSPYKPVSKEMFLKARLMQLEPQLVKAAGAPKYRAELEAQQAALAKALDGLSPEEKQEQAIVRGPYETKKIFATEAEGGRKIATISGSLFDGQGSRDVIRTIVVYWRWDPKEPAKAAMIERFKKALDFAALKALLGK